MYTMGNPGNGDVRMHKRQLAAIFRYGSHAQPDYAENKVKEEAWITPLDVRKYTCPHHMIRKDRGRLFRTVFNVILTCKGKSSRTLCLHSLRAQQAVYMGRGQRTECIGVATE